MRTFRHAVVVLALPLTLVLVGAKDCPPPADGGTESVEKDTPCTNARAAADRLYGIYDKNPTRANKNASDRAERKAQNVCAAG